MTDAVDRLRRIERAALESLHDVAPVGIGSSFERIGGAEASIVSSTESVVVNRVAGLGVGDAATEAEVAAIAGRYASAGIRRHLVHLDPDARPADLAEWLDRAGYRPHRGWAQFARPLGGAPLLEARTDLVVRVVTDDTAVAFGRIASAAFDLGEALVPAVAGLARHPAWRLYLTFDESGEPAGTGGLFLHEGAGWLDWAATRLEFRRRGSQGALMARRLLAAAEAGCDLVFTETGEAVPGDPQHSYRNIERAGFEVLRVRPNRILER